MKTILASLFIFLILNVSAYARGECKNLKTNEVLPESYCIEQASFQSAYRLVVYKSKLSQGTELHPMRYKVAVSAYIALNSFMDETINIRINKLNSEKCEDAEYKDTIEKWLIEQYQARTINLSEKYRKTITERSIKSMVAVLNNDNYAKYCSDDEYDKYLFFNNIDTGVHPIKVYSQGIAYLKIDYFKRTTPFGVQKEVLSVLKPDNTIKGIIIDLRDNPGGSLEGSVWTAGLFLSSVRITSIHNTDGEKKINAGVADITKGVPIAILSNGESASASEIVMLALRENDRAIVIGERSFGKGTIQNVRTLPNGGKVVVTVGNYYSPKGNSIDGIGIQPDILIDSKTPSRCTIKDEKHLDAYMCVAYTYLLDTK